MRITAVQALKKIDPEWAERFLPRCGLSDAELKLTALDPDPDTPWLRQRRYVRVNLPRPLGGVVRPEQSHHKISVQQLSLGGGVARSQCHIKPGSTVPLELQSGLHRIHARVLVREARPQELTFELVQISSRRPQPPAPPAGGITFQGKLNVRISGAGEHADSGLSMCTRAGVVNTRFLQGHEPHPAVGMQPRRGWFLIAGVEQRVLAMPLRNQAQRRADGIRPEAFPLGLHHICLPGAQ